MTGFAINPPNAALVDDRGYITPEWYKFFVQVQRMIGGPVNPFDDVLLSTQVTSARHYESRDTDDFTPPSLPVAAEDDLTPPAIPAEAQDVFIPPSIPIEHDDLLYPPRYGA